MARSAVYSIAAALAVTFLLFVTSHPEFKITEVLAAEDNNEATKFEPDYKIVEGKYDNEELGFSFVLPDGLSGFATEYFSDDGNKSIGIQIHPGLDSTEASECCPPVDTAPVVMLLDTLPLSALSTPVLFTGDLYAAFQGYNMRMNMGQFNGTEVLVITLESERNDLPSTSESVKRLGKFYFMNSDTRSLSFGIWASEENFYKYMDEFEFSANSITLNNSTTVDLDSVFDQDSARQFEIQLEDGSIVRPKVTSSSLVESVVLDEKSKLLRMNITESSGNGFLILNAGDVLAGPHMVTSDGRPVESNTVSNERGSYLLLFYNESGVHDIAISGSAVLPEFPVTWLIMAVTIGSIIGVTALRRRATLR